MSSDPTKQMEEFIELVNKASEEKLDLMLHNGSYAHARILFDKIIQHANNKISLITKQCNEIFYEQENVYKAFLDFISRTAGKGEVRIIVESQNTEEEIRSNPFINKLLDAYTKKENRNALKVYKLKDNNFIKVEGNLSHMLLADSDGPYRFETHLEEEKHNGDSEVEWQNMRTDAIANFGDSLNSKNLSSFFNSLLENNVDPVAL